MDCTPSAMCTLLGLANAVHDSVNAALKPLGLTHATYRVLAQVGHDSLTHKTLAEHTNCGASNITRIVGRLETQGLVSREPSEEDRRAVLTRLTPEGLATLREAEALLASVEQHLLTLFAEAELPAPGERS